MRRDNFPPDGRHEGHRPGTHIIAKKNAPAPTRRTDATDVRAPVAPRRCPRSSRTYRHLHAINDLGDSWCRPRGARGIVNRLPR